MTRRFVVLVAVGYALVVIQASLQAVIPLRVVAPELGLLVAIYAGLTAQGNVSGACAVAFTLGYVTDLLAGAPKGMHAMTFVLICLLSKGASLRFLLGGVFMPAALSFFLSCSGALLVLSLRAGLSAHASLYGSSMSALAIAPLQAAVTAVFAPLVFGLLARALGKARGSASAAMGRR